MGMKCFTQSLKGLLAQDLKVQFHGERERERERERDRQTDRQRADFNQSLTQALLDLSLFQKLSICNNHFYTVWIDIYHLQSNKSQSVIDSFNSALS